MKTITVKVSWTFDASESYQKYLDSLEPDEEPMKLRDFAEMDLEEFDFNIRNRDSMAITVTDIDK